MNDNQNLLIEPLNSGHDKSAFDCGVSSLNYYLKKQAGQDIKRRISRVFVATTLDQPTRIVGYYTLSSLSIELNELPQNLSRKLPRHPIPAALIGRLAINQQDQGNGIGQMLMANGIRRTLNVSSDIAIYAMVVDAINEDAQHFYEKFGFIRLNVEHRRLFLPLNKI
jgi:ribosomal protein S18 acetylase RimI-like enzyme